MESTREGFTLIEVVVAMVILSAVLVMLAGMTFATAQRTVDLRSAGARQAVMLQEVNRMSALRVADMEAEEGCRTVGTGGDQFNACIDVEAPAPRTRRVTVVVTAARPGVRPDTVRFTRSEPAAGNPFNCPSC